MWKHSEIYYYLCLSFFKNIFVKNRGLETKRINKTKQRGEGGGGGRKRRKITNKIC